MAQSKNSDRRIGVFIRVVSLVVLGLGFFMAQSASWVNHAVFNEQNFTKTATGVILSQRSRDAIAQTIVDDTLSDRPLVKRAIGSQATSFVSSTLGSTLSENVVSGVVARSYAYLTTPNREDITIDLTTIKQPLAGIISFVENRGQQVQFNATSIPDTIVILRADALPDISGIVQNMLILGVVFWLITVVGGLVFVFYSRASRRRRAYQLLGVLAAASIVALFVGPFIPQVVASFIDIISLRGVASDMTSAFLAPFGAQMIWSLVVCGLLFLVVYFWWVFPKVWRTITASIPVSNNSKKK